VKRLPLVVALAVSALAVPRGQIPDPSSLTRVQDAVAERVSSNNPDPESNDDSWRPIAGETVTLAELTGPGVVTHLWITVAANEYGWPRLLRLRAYYDGNAIPSVDCPLGDFFGVGHGFERPVNSLMARDSSSGRSRNSYWQMPFKRSLRLTITNEGRRRVSNLYFHVDWKKVPSLPPGTAYFHARYRQALPTAPGRPYEIASIAGRGQYVGTVLSVVQNEPGWFGEGDERFYVDGSQVPSIEGTGTEDYFNDAWSFRVSDGLYTGVTIADGTGVGARLSAFRWHVVDPVPFQRSLRLDIEHRGWTYKKDGTVRSAFEERADLFSSVGFWYQDGIANDQPSVPYGSARLPIGNARQIEAEDTLPGVTAERGTASVQKDVFWSRDLLFLDAKGVGAKISVPFDVDEDGRYELVAQLAHSPDYGVYTVELDGQSTSSSQALEHEPGANMGDASRIDAYFTETYVAEDHLIGWAHLTKGRHALTFTCVGKNASASGYNLGIDTVIVAALSPQTPSDDQSRAEALRTLGDRRPARPQDVARALAGLTDPSSDVRIAAAWAAGQLGTSSPAAIESFTRALEDSDHVVRGLAALALRNAGTASTSATRSLVSRLEDSEIGVRMMAAQALGRVHDPSTIDALLAAARAPEQPVHVLRSVADALGSFGPQAARALPTLTELARIPRVEWSARAAIRKIGKP